MLFDEEAKLRELKDQVPERIQYPKFENKEEAEAYVTLNGKPFGGLNTGDIMFRAMLRITQDSIERHKMLGQTLDLNKREEQVAMVAAAATLWFMEFFGDEWKKDPNRMMAISGIWAEGAIKFGGVSFDGFPDFSDKAPKTVH